MRANSVSSVFRTEKLMFLLLLIGIAAIAPIVKQQFITGTIVNACLIVAACSLGVRDGLLVGIIPSSISLAAGLLPAPLAPMIPFIILGNSILVLTVSYLDRFNYWVGVVAGSLLKFGLIFGSSIFVVGMINVKMASAAAQSMNWPQLVTALLGGTLAFGVLHFVNKNNSRSRV